MGHVQNTCSLHAPQSLNSDATGLVGLNSKPIREVHGKQMPEKEHDPEVNNNRFHVLAVARKQHKTARKDP